MTAVVRQSALGSRRGSALILTVVLASLLAILGVLFLLTMRMDRMATTATSESRQLDRAVETVMAEIGDILVRDVPGVARGAEYYDYPGPADPWLADLEPYKVGSGSNEEYYWRQVSDITGAMGNRARNVLISMVGEREAIDAFTEDSDPNADADGDGVSDALWFELANMTSDKGKPIYAAVRIVDNGGMVNLNSGYWFAPELGDPSYIDGHSPLHINAVAFAGPYEDWDHEQERAEALLLARSIDPSDANEPSVYEARVIWNYLQPTNPASHYTPFDISDELDLRFRFILERRDIEPRAELWGDARLAHSKTIYTPVDHADDFDVWFPRVCLGDPSDGTLDDSYAYRHVATTYNMDRIIMPGPSEPNEPLRGVRKMVCVNYESLNAIYEAVKAALIDANPNEPVQIIEDDAAQIAVNVVDYIDDDDEITAMPRPTEPNEWINGFECPRVYVSEITYHGVRDAGTGVVHESYAIELYKPYFEDPDPLDSQWELHINNPLAVADVTIEIDWSGSRRFHVMLAEEPGAELFEDSEFSDPNEPADASSYGYIKGDYANPQAQVDADLHFEEGAEIELRRRTTMGEDVVVDYVKIPHDWMELDAGVRSIQRDISPHKCIRRLWATVPGPAAGLGSARNPYVDTAHPEIIQAHPANRRLKNIGELGMVFARNAYNVPNDRTAEDVLINLAQSPSDPDDPNLSSKYGQLLNYLTVIDPNYWTGNINETRIMGRININTAPWFVLAQLPWMQEQADGTPTFARAVAVANYRDSRGLPFTNTAEMLRVPELRQMQFDDSDNLYDNSLADPSGETPWGPDLTYDTARDDLEERDILFTRMSDLVTVRSDVFTAYILVRIGLDGPQKRVVAILDRSQVTGSNDGVRVVAIQAVPDPR